VSLVDRLRGVIRDAGGSARHPSSGRQRLAESGVADVLGGEWRDAGGERFLVVDRTYRPGHRHGSVTVADALPSSDGLWPGLELLHGRAAPAVSRAEAAAEGGRALFFDLETTGLAGGAGTYAFLVGCGWFDGGSFHTRQFFLSDFGAERGLLDAVAESANDAGTVVTYNGKSFDLPLMETRFVLHRRETPFAGLPHVDMLHPARRLWRGDESGCRLTSLEQILCGYHREGDVPGFEIPARYFRYVRSGDARPLEAVLEHNRLDLLALACVTARAAQLLDEGPAAARGAREALGLGQLYERHGRLREARACFIHARAFDTDAVRVEALHALALVSRRLRCHEDAAAAWRQLMECPDCPEPIVREASEALAVHHEHRARNLSVARALTLRSLTCQGTMARRELLQHRLKRLDRKIGDRNEAVLF
jgi:uncharacterized protein YprB with RNaseH-like and TPR domain